jgi:rhamnosyltransferase
MTNNVVAVIVIFYPNKTRLKKLIKTLIYQVVKIIVVDNTPVKDEYDLLEENKYNIELISFDENNGIAKAQNIGIKRALELSADFVLLSDQDTLFPDNYVYKMLKDISDYNIHEIACIVPLFKDINQKRIPNQGFIRFTFCGWKRFFPKQGLYEIDEAISSGKLINLKLINLIGLMNESLFIDWVDYEWCWRARRQYKIIGNANVIINHRLGDSAVSVGFREVNQRPPIRSYYITRNAIYLALYSTSLNFVHRFILLFKTTRYIIGFPILCKPHIQQFNFTIRGVIDGFRKRLGKINL